MAASANQELWIVGRIEETGQIFLDFTTRTNRQTPDDISRRNSWAGYIGLKRYKYAHKVVDYDGKFVNDTGVTTNCIEATSGAPKRLFEHIRNKQRDMVFGYLAEFLFRKKFNMAVFKNTVKEIRNIYKPHREF
ncbi:hypothetical protein RF11_02116 [Thelohanellus kitauei]|uniref:Uncharacterized protein n=1 Tax=Thelohanellus kitauei TaxID=669202 RepID=A0A0C2MW68_THEKT|nr:hypothetical protein RF11_02116 [Thelohanellus kitauei]